MKGRITRYVLLVLVNLCIIFMVIETGLRLYSSTNIIYDLEMHKYAVELKRSSVVPGLTHEHVPNEVARLMGVEFATNSMGFRDDELTLSEDQTNYKILVLGCSNTVGWGVEHENVFTSLLENKFNNGAEDTVFHVINAGVGNYNTQLESVQLADRIDGINPQMVVVHYYINDAEIIIGEKVSPLVENSYLFAILKNRLEYNEFSSVFDDVGGYYASLYQIDSPGWVKAQKAILKMKDLCEEKGVIFKVLMQPDLHDLSENSDQARCHKKIASFLQGSSISYLDLMPSYSSRNVENVTEFWVHPEDAHPNKFGHKVIFEAAYPFIRNSISAR